MRVPLPRIEAFQDGNGLLIVGHVQVAKEEAYVSFVEKLRALPMPEIIRSGGDMQTMGYFCERLFSPGAFKRSASESGYEASAWAAVGTSTGRQPPDYSSSSASRLVTVRDAMSDRSHSTVLSVVSVSSTPSTLRPQAPLMGLSNSTANSIVIR